MPRVRLNLDALRIAGVPLGTPLLVAPRAWDSDVELPEEAPETPEFIRPGLAFIDIRGPLDEEPDQMCGWWDGYAGEDGIAARFERAANDPATVAILIHFKTPGGTSAGIIECCKRMIAARDAAGIPVIGWVTEACSAGYWLAMVCDGGLFGNEQANAGSIGSYIPHESIAALLEKEGVVMTLVADPPGKTAGNPFEALSDVARSRLERGVKKCTGQFMAAVETARPELSEKVLRELDGDVLEGVDAVNAGLLDGVTDFETTIEMAFALAEARKAA